MFEFKQIREGDSLRLSELTDRYYDGAKPTPRVINLQSI